MSGRDERPEELEREEAAFRVKTEFEKWAEAIGVYRNAQRLTEEERFRFGEQQAALRIQEMIGMAMFMRETFDRDFRMRLTTRIGRFKRWLKNVWKR